MTKIILLPIMAGTLLACSLTAASAQEDRTWVSGLGTDAGACTRDAPCKTFAFALTQTNPGGEIDVLDSADYGPVIITKSISIINDGAGVASIGVSSNNAIEIDAGPRATVHLRGLSLQGVSGGGSAGLSEAQNGILFNTGKNLTIENCAAHGFFFAGINIEPRTSASITFSVSNTISSNNGRGIVVLPIGTAAVSGVIRNVTTNNNFNGIHVNGEMSTAASFKVTIVDSEAFGNGFFGIRAVSTSGNAPTAVMLRNYVSSNNGFGLVAGDNAVLRVAHSVVTRNGGGLSASASALLDSYGDNAIDGNTNDNYGALTTIPTR